MTEQKRERITLERIYRMDQARDDGWESELGKLAGVLDAKTRDSLESK